MPQKDLHEENRISWNAATKQHNSHKGDQAQFLRDGGSTLFPDEIELLGDLQGKSLLHLQCNAGQDTLSIASQLGAIVIGVDISDEAITFAQQLSAESGIPGTFIRSDLYDWFEANTQQYDMAFTSYGTIVWLSDLRAWARGISKALKPGGRFVFLDFHPVLAMFDDGWRMRWDYMGGTSSKFEWGVGDYVALSEDALLPNGGNQATGDGFQNPNPSNEFYWGVADIVTALLDAGLQLETLREYPYINGFKAQPDMRPLDGRRWTVPEDKPTLPLMLGIVVRK